MIFKGLHHSYRDVRDDKPKDVAVLREIDPGTRFQLGSVLEPSDDRRGMAADLDLREQFLTSLDLATLQASQERRRERLLADHQIGDALR